MAKIIITKLNLNAQPLVNQTCTVRYRIKGSQNWTTAANNVVVLPTGFLQAPLEIGVADGQIYEVWGQNNCGGAGTVVEFSTQGVQSSIIFQNLLTAGTIQQVLIDGQNVLNAPIAAGGFFQYDYGQSGLDAGAHTIELVLGGVANGTKLHKRAIRGFADLQPGYVTYAGAAFEIYDGGLMTSDIFVLRNANAHLNVANYSTEEGAITGACTINGGKVVRNQQAIDDSVATNQSVRAFITWSSNSPASMDATADFAPGDSESAAGGEVSATPCTAVAGAVNTINII